MEDCSIDERLQQETLCRRQWTDEYIRRTSRDVDEAERSHLRVSLEIIIIYCIQAEFWPRPVRPRTMVYHSMPLSIDRLISRCFFHILLQRFTVPRHSSHFFPRRFRVARAPGPWRQAAEPITIDEWLKPAGHWLQPTRYGGLLCF